MKYFQYANLAKADLRDIATYTKETWGEEQADRYLAQLEDRCQLLAEHPELGRSASTSHLGLRRIEQGSHVIFYRQQDHVILIIRILHKAMLPEIHSLDES